MDRLEQRQLLAAASYRVNFQPASSPAVDGYSPDNGAVFGTRSGGQQYGWNIDNTANTRVRGIDPNPLNDRLIHLQVGGNHVWEYALPNGSYAIELHYGDPAYTDQINNFQVEDRTFNGGTSGTIGGGRTGTNVTVSDGRLTVSPGAGASNAKLNYIVISTAETTQHPAPSEVQAVAQSGPSVLVKWKNNSPAADGFNIDRRVAGTSTWSGIGSVSSDQVTYTDTNVTRGTTYEYRVWAFAQSQIPSDYSNVATVTVPAAETGFQSADIGSPSFHGSTNVIAPGVDYDILAGGTDVWGRSDQFRFVYKQVTGDFDFSARVTDTQGVNSGSMAGLMARESLAADSRHIYMRARDEGLRANYRSTTGGESTGVGNIALTFPNAYVRLQRVGNVFTAYGSTNGTTWTPLTQQTMAMPSTLYFGIAVSARSSSGDSVRASIRGLTDRLATGTTKPAAPTIFNVATSQAPYGLKINWTDNSNNETGFLIERRVVGSSASFTTVGTVNSNVTDFLDTQVGTGIEYIYRISAVNSAGATPSAEVRTTVAVQLPNSPTNLRAVNTPNGVDVRWDQVGGPRFDSFIVQRDQTDGTQTFQVSDSVGYFLDTTASSGTQYTYRVFAVNESGHSPASAPVTIVAQKASEVPSAPAHLTAVVHRASVDLRWTDTSSNSVGVRIERRVVGTATWTAIIDANEFGGEDAWHDSTVVGGTSYEYRVFVKNSVGTSAPSNSVTATVPSVTGLVSADIGLTGGSTQVVTEGKDFNLTSRGADVWNTSDQFRFLSKQVTGDFDIKVRVEGITAADAQSMGGLMARASLAANSQNVFVKAIANGKDRLTYRASSGGTSTGAGGSTGQLPKWVRLVRQGNTFYGYVSYDNNNPFWNEVSELTMAMPATVYLGLAASSHMSSAATTVRFRDLTLGQA